MTSVTSSLAVLPSFDPIPALAAELSLPVASVKAVVDLLAEGGTVPFIARYRKEATGGLDEVQIRAIEERKAYLVEIDTRRRSVLAEIDKQGKLTQALRDKIVGTVTKAELEDLYLPFKPKRRTRSTIAEERGLAPLAELIWAQGLEGSPLVEAQRFVDAAKEVPDGQAALAGARDIIAERFAEGAEIRKATREFYLKEGVLVVEKSKAFEDKATKFDNYAQFSEPVANIASHRYLAVRRGESEGVLRGVLEVDGAAFADQALRSAPLVKDSPWREQLELAVRDSVSRLLLTSAQVDVRVELKMRADKQAVDVFAKNLRELLMAPPFGTRAVLGIDPGQRTGCKCVVVDDTGKLLANDTIYLVQGEGQLKKAEQTILDLARRFPIQAIAVGNGTHGRETEAFVKKLLASPSFISPVPEKPFCVAVSESGASIYSASDVAREEFPDLDLTVRGAISIARRLQDPLAELVKLDPKSIGVGQYQHDVYQAFLGKKLDEVVESCVHEVGVELNTASAQLLARVSGVGPSLGKRIVEHRNQKGSFKNRKQLLDVVGLGPRAFEQAAAFLRIRGAENPLDASAVHPERYQLVERMAADLGVPVDQLIGSRELLSRLDKTRYAGGDVGSFTLDDIFAELLKPGRDPRKHFEPPQFREDVTRIEDLKPDMLLEGVVTNVTAFGAFVDVGVHQDGLVHLSKLSDRFIKDPSEVVKVGDKLTVRVVEVDLERQRISLTARTGERAEGGRAAEGSAGANRGQAGRGPGQNASGRGPGGQGGPGGSGRGPGGPNRGGQQGNRQGEGNNRQQGQPAGDLKYNPFADLLRR
ncbi:MAG TPA: Tex family protein [Polyangiaceae bacterium]|nr:Tex family protein [Polyangiaceae bacterium]